MHHRAGPAACVVDVMVMRAKMMPLVDDDICRSRACRGLRMMRFMWMSCCCWHAVDATDANIAAHRRPSAKSSRTPRRGVQPGARGGRLRHGIRDSAAAFGWALPARRPPDPPRKDFARQPGRGALASPGSRPFPQSPFMPQSPVPVLPPSAPSAAPALSLYLAS